MKSIALAIISLIFSTQLFADAEINCRVKSNFIVMTEHEGRVRGTEYNRELDRTRTALDGRDKSLFSYGGMAGESLGVSAHGGSPYRYRARVRLSWINDNSINIQAELSALRVLDENGGELNNTNEVRSVTRNLSYSHGDSRNFELSLSNQTYDLTPSFRRFIGPFVHANEIKLECAISGDISQVELQTDSFLEENVDLSARAEETLPLEVNTESRNTSKYEFGPVRPIKDVGLATQQ